MVGANLLVFFALAAGALILLAAVVTMASGKLPKKGFPTGNMSPGTADLLAGRSAQLLGVYIAFSFGLGIIAAPLLRGASDNVQRIATVALYGAMIIAYVALMKVPIGGRRFGLKDLGWGKLKMSHVGWGVGAALANAPLVLATAVLGQKLMPFLPPAQHPLTVEMATEKMGPLALLSIFLIACVAAPITEELMFRATMAPAMSRVLKSPALGIFLSSFFFAAIHPTGIPAWPALATVGAMSAFLCYRTGSLMPSLIMHGVHNFGVLLISLAVL